MAFVLWPNNPPPLMWQREPGVRPHYEGLEWTIKDDGYGLLVANPPSMDEQVVQFMNEDLH